ncbi:MAG TPA: DUF4834 family protein [Candidatus Bacteroides pullicola]|uniref:DUF4834 family protein n=1 Tax=Candidatus Bacteroides pullicola TaxID=2838475 RepID=A0A9D1ZHP4_9BACE|nr:DUF4834 family protein [Candidatus Bacteroides pullicola]
MFHFLGFILLLVLAVLLVGFVIVVAFVRRLFGMGKGKKQTTTYYYTTRNPRNDSANTRRGNASAGDDTVAVEEGELHINRKKIFGKDEGEYVSYEEVKE